MGLLAAGVVLLAGVFAARGRLFGATGPTRSPPPIRAAGTLTEFPLDAGPAKPAIPAGVSASEPLSVSAAGPNPVTLAAPTPTPVPAAVPVPEPPAAVSVPAPPLFAPKEATDEHAAPAGEFRIGDPEMAAPAPPAAAVPSARPGPPPIAVPSPPPPPDQPPPLPAPQRVAISDTFRRADAGPWLLGAADLALGGRARVFYLPLVGGGWQHVVGARIHGNALENIGQDYGGVQFTRALAERGVNVGQDLNIRVDLCVPTDAAGHLSQAGPYFRSRAAAAGDGILGGASAGYWVALHSTGEVKVKLLNGRTSNPVVATSGVPGRFDATRFHALEIAAQGDLLEVALDGRRLMFSQHNRLTTRVAIPPLWLGLPPVGSNDGAAGIWFGAEDNRGRIGGQRAARLVVAAFGTLAGLPVTSNFPR